MKIISDIRSVVPTGEVDSKMTKLSFLKNGIIDSTAFITKLISGFGSVLFLFLKGVGTAIMKISASVGFV